MCGSRPCALAHHVAPGMSSGRPVARSSPASDRRSLHLALCIQDLYRTEGSRACNLVIHDREGISCAERDGCFPQRFSGSGPWAVECFGGECRQFGHPPPRVFAARVELFPCKTGLKIRKYGAASAPLPDTHCHPAGLLASSASTSVSQNHASPSRQSISKCLVRNDAVTMRTRLCIQPVCQSSRMPASTSGYPVFPFATREAPWRRYATAWRQTDAGN